MKRILLIFVAILISSNAFAGTITQDTIYATNGQVTATNLNNNFSTIINEVNANLDNDNADTADGFRFIEVKGSLPVAGTQGRTVFLTTDNTLNFDDGSAYVKAITATGTPVQGDVLYYNGTAWTRLGAGVDEDALTTQGTGANPAFSAVPPTGSLVMWTTDTAPTEWILCDGSAQDATADTTLQRLFDVIGTTFGGADNTDFEVPDMRGRFPLGQDDMGGSSANRVTSAQADSVGGSAGSETIAEGQLPAHSHFLNEGSGTQGTSSLRNVLSMQTDSVTNGLETTDTGSGTAYNQPFLTLNYIIKK